MRGHAQLRNTRATLKEAEEGETLQSKKSRILSHKRGLNSKGVIHAKINGLAPGEPKTCRELSGHQRIPGKTGNPVKYESPLGSAI